jgi:hypothetical protein
MLQLQQHVLGPTRRLSLRSRYVPALLPAVVLFLGALHDTAKADDFAYAEFSGGGLFGVLNLTTGQFTPRGSFQGRCCVGMGEVGNTLYGIGGPPDSGNYTTLYQINPANGGLTAVGSGSASFHVFGSTNAGLFGVGYDMKLYSVNPATGSSTVIGSTGLNLPAHDGLSSGGNTLFFTAQYGNSTPALYSLNTQTGAATLMASTAALYAPVYESGQLYASTLPPISIYTVNPNTGANTLASSLPSTFTEIIDAMALRVQRTVPVERSR